VTFETGDRVVYPSHGVAVVESVEDRTVGDSACSCYCLRLLTTETSVIVPVQNADTIGLRRTVQKRDVLRVLDRLRGGDNGTRRDWRDRFKENTDRLRTGQLGDVADVLSNLAGLAGERALSYREKRMMEKARDLLIGEIAAVQSVPIEDATAQVEKALGAES